MTSNTNLFGCCSGEKNNIIREYQFILAKALIEDREFFDDMLPGLDINEDFIGELTLRTIIGNLIDMRARYDSEVTHDALEMEVRRRVHGDWENEEITETFKRLREDVPQENLELCKEQFSYWKQFTTLARIANATTDMLREPWFVTDSKINRIIEEVQGLAGQLSQVTISCKKSNDWTD